jgi:hypothetical protein
VPTANASIEIGWAPTLGGAVSSLAHALHERADQPVALVPSTLDANDPVVADLRAALRAHGMRTTVLVPRGTASLAAGALSRRGRKRWQPIATDDRTYRLDARLLTGPWIALAIVDETHRSGPFVLDLAARFLHPTDRLRLLARPDRSLALADISAVARPSTSLVIAPVAGGWLTVRTRDAIAAELWALALAEPHHDQRMEMQGPWEDPTVQRATELELGARIPQEIRPDIIGSLPEPVATVVERAARSLGLHLVARNLHGDKS